jgi:hypothetical protein
LCPFIAVKFKPVSEMQRMKAVATAAIEVLAALEDVAKAAEYLASYISIVVNGRHLLLSARCFA